MRGRKSKFETDVKPRFPEILEWLELGCTEREIAENLGIAVSTFNEYKKHPEFSDLLKNGRKKPVIQIKHALFKRACGFHEIEISVFESSDGTVNKTTKQRYFPPDPASAMILLKHWDKEGEWTQDPQILDLRRKEYELRKKEFEKNNW